MRSSCCSWLTHAAEWEVTTPEAVTPFLQLELTAKRHSDLEVFVCWSEFGTLPRTVNCKSMEHKAKSVQVSARLHAGVALGVVGIRDSEWARRDHAKYNPYKGDRK